MNGITFYSSHNEWPYSDSVYPFNTTYSGEQIEYDCWYNTGEVTPVGEPEIVIVKGTLRFPRNGGTIATEEYVNEKVASSGGSGANLTTGSAAGSIQQVGYNNVLGAVASGEGAVAFGGQRFDKAGKDVSEEPQTEAKGVQSFAQGGGVIVEGPWSAGFGKDSKTYQKASFSTGGGNQAGCTPEEFEIYHDMITTNTQSYEDAYSFAFAEG